MQESRKSDNNHKPHPHVFNRPSLSESDTPDILKSRLLDWISDAVISTDKSLTITSWNYTAEEIYGYSEDEALGRQLDELLNTDFIGTNQAQAREMLCKNGKWEGEVWQTCKDGTSVFIRARVSRLYDKYGAYIGGVTVNRDITSEKEAELLRNREMQYRLMADNIADVIFLTDADIKRFIFISPSAENLLGYTKAEMEAGEIIDFIDSNLKGEILKEIEQTLSEEEKGSGRDTPRHWSGKWIRKDGNTIWVELTVRPVRDKSGVFRGAVGVLRDVSKRIKAEKELQKNEKDMRQILSCTSDLVIHMDNNFRSIYANPAVYKTLGLNREKDAGKPMEEMGVPPELSNMLHERYKKVLETGEEEIFEFQLNTNDKGVRTFQAHVSANNYNTQKPDGLISFMRDITELKETHLKLKDAIKAKDLFFNILAHDLRNPLINFLSYAEILQEIEKFDADTIKDTSLDFKEAAENLYSLLDNLLTWAQLQRGILVPEKQIVEISRLIEDVCNDIKQEAIRKKIMLKTDKMEVISIEADPAMLKTVFRNILTNSIKFTHPEGTINTLVFQKDSKVVIKIKDTGIGIPKDKVNEIFRIDGTYRRKGTANERSTGIGLPLCKEFVTLHNGDIWVESKQHKGTAVCIELPVKE